MKKGNSNCDTGRNLFTSSSLQVCKIHKKRILFPKIKISPYYSLE